MLKEINYRSDEQLRAWGRNGGIKQVGMEIMTDEQRISLFPISTRGKCDSCKLEIPNDPETLMAIIEVLNQAMNAEKQHPNGTSETITVLNTMTASKLLDELKQFSAAEFAGKKANELMLYWYAVCYSTRGLHPDSEESCGEFAPLVDRMFELYSEGAFGDDQLYPVEVSKAGVLGTEIEIDKNFTVYPKQ